MNTADDSLRCAARMWGKLSRSAKTALKQTVATYQLSVAGGDVQFLEGHWYITHSGLPQGCWGWIRSWPATPG